ncbi:MAG TPA: proline--tRNA ligase [Gaiellales bacterium]|nr:proline--tRNA ligase [Gaiellales bacterium]
MSGSVDASRYLIPTLKDDPADAEAISHKLLVRGGFVRQVGAGLYTYLPLGWKVLQNAMGIIREEMDTIGLEMLMPVLQPAELWEATGRSNVDNLFHLDDSSGKHYVLAMTHEECITWHAARTIRSYRELPQIWYHQQTKERDEPRPRGGILRTREFIMKDSYSFDRDLEGLEESYAKHRVVYQRIFERSGLETFAIEADVGMMGGHGGEEFVAPSPNGEADLVRCSNCDYAANVEVAKSRPRPPEFPPTLDAPEEVETPGATTIDALAKYLGIDPAATAKAMPIVVDGQVVLALVRGDHRLHELKTQKALGGPFRAAEPAEIRETFGADPGSIGPVGTGVRVIADETLRDGQFVGGANRTGWHLRGVEAGRDYRAEFHDLREVGEGDTCAVCGTGTLHIEPAIEVGHIFKLGTRYTVPLNANYLDEAGKEHPIVMGSYGIGPARIAAVAVEQHHDEAGIAWPATLAPFHVHMVVIGGADDPQFPIAREIQRTLEADGLSVLFDDRSASPGSRFADAELIGMPARVTVGKRTAADGTADVQVRRGREQRSLAVAEVAAAVRAAVDAA